MRLTSTLLRGSFRRRLSLVFLLVAGVSSGVLAVGASMVVTSYRHHSFIERARLDAEQDLALWDADDPPEQLIERLEAFERPGGPGVIVISRDGFDTSSIERLSEDDLPSEIRARSRAAGGALVEADARVVGEPYLVIGQLLEPQSAEVYFFYSKSDLLEGLTQLRVTLLAGWVLVTAGAAVAGHVVARRTLRPVQEAADAARSVTEGLLATRLPVEGHDEFAQWNDAFNEMVAALEEKLQALADARDRERRFNADVAHELRTPLGALVTAATLIEEEAGALPAHLRRPAELVVDGARRLSRLVEELLELHTIDAGQGAVHWEVTDVGHGLRSTLHAHGWEEQVELVAPDQVVVLTDRWRLDRILVNLVSNALRYGAPPVQVHLRRLDGVLEIDVSDAGVGVAEGDRERIFERHFKVSAARTSFVDAQRSVSGGSGLGLPIARKSARLLGGDITALEDGAGRTVFRVRLPVGADESADEAVDGAGRRSAGTTVG